jgi:Ca2+-binding RTX toxin-like protein
MAIRTGTSRNDTLIGTPGPDRLFRLGGDDRLAGRAGPDRLDGSIGSDTAAYGRIDGTVGSRAGVTVVLTRQLGLGGDAQGDVRTGIESLVGSDFGDQLVGDAGVNRLAGGTEADRLDGRGGNDFLDGGPGADRLDGAYGADRALGGAGDDVIRGGAGDDVLDGGLGMAPAPRFRMRDPTPAGDQAGRFVALDGDTLVLATWANQPVDHVLHLVDVPSGQVQVTLRDPTGQTGTNFGGSVDIDADRILVGAPFSVEQAGAAYLFDDRGHLLRTFANPDPTGPGVFEFGSEVALAGDHAAATNVYANVYPVRVFDARTGALRLSIPGGISDTELPTAFEAEGDLLAITGSGQPPARTAAFIFDLRTGRLVRELNEPAPFAELGQAFGTSISLDRGRVLVGTHAIFDFNRPAANSEPTRAYLFDAVSGRLLRTFETPDPDTQGFGIEMLDGDRALFRTFTGPEQATGNWVFHLFDVNTGEELQSFPGPGIDPPAGMAVRDVALDGNRLMVRLAGPTAPSEFLFYDGADFDDGADRLVGGVGDDRLSGGSRNDVLFGNDGADQLFGDIGDDLLAGGTGPDLLDGGYGHDTAHYADSRGAVTVDLATGTGRGGDAEGDRLVRVERLTGSARDDTLTGSAAANVLDGGSGDDRLDGGAGRDTLVGGPGNDRLSGGMANDVLRGGTGNDVLDGGSEGNQLFGEDGDDWLSYNPGHIPLQEGWPSALDGGRGTDTLAVTNEAIVIEWDPSGMFREIPSWTHLTLSRTSPDEPVAGRIRFSGPDPDQPSVVSPPLDADLRAIERFEITGGAPLVYQSEGAADVSVTGTRFGDRFLGGRSDETFLGGGGDDYMAGGPGDDRLVSEPADADRFAFAAVDAGRDRIDGFNGAGAAGGDVIEFAGLRAADLRITVVGGHTGFAWVDGSVDVDAAGLVAGLDYLFL